MIILSYYNAQFYIYHKRIIDLAFGYKDAQILEENNVLLQTICLYLSIDKKDIIIRQRISYHGSMLFPKILHYLNKRKKRNAIYYTSMIYTGCSSYMIKQLAILTRTMRSGRIAILQNFHASKKF